MMKLSAIVAAFTSVIAENIVSFSHEGGKQVVKLNSDEKLVVKLSGTPSTGYAWNEIEVPESLIRRTTKGFEASPGVGSPGNFFFYYDPYRVGSGSLKFMYSREWEKADDVNAIRNFAEVAFEIATPDEDEL